MVKDSALIQNSTLLMFSKVRRALDIPKVPSEKEKSFRFLLEIYNEALSGIAKR